jgi:hypothetical protein
MTNNSTILFRHTKSFNFLYEIEHCVSEFQPADGKGFSAVWVFEKHLLHPLSSCRIKIDSSELFQKPMLRKANVVRRHEKPQMPHGNLRKQVVVSQR